jgi:hypothetical protein
MLITIIICLLTWLILRFKKPLVRSLVFLMAIGIAAVTAYFSVFWVIDKVTLFPDYYLIIFNPICYPLSVIGLHEEAAGIYMYQVYLGSPMGPWLLFCSTIISPIDLSAQLQLQMGIFIWLLTSAATILVLLIFEAIRKISQPEQSSQ